MPTGRSLSKLGYDTGQHSTSDGSAGQTSLAKCHVWKWKATGNGTCGNATDYAHETKMSKFIITSIDKGAWVIDGGHQCWTVFGGNTFDEDDVDGSDSMILDPLMMLDGNLNEIAYNSYGFSLTQNCQDETNVNVYLRNFGSSSWYNSGNYAAGHDDAQHNGHMGNYCGYEGSAAWKITHWETNFFNCTLNWKAAYIGKYNEFDKDTGNTTTNWGVVGHVTATGTG